MRRARICGIMSLSALPRTLGESAASDHSAPLDGRARIKSIISHAAFFSQDDADIFQRFYRHVLYGHLV